MFNVYDTNSKNKYDQRNEQKVQTKKFTENLIIQQTYKEKFTPD